MKKKTTYEDVYLEVTIYSSEDIITTSGFCGKDDEIVYEW